MLSEQSKLKLQGSVRSKTQWLGLAVLVVSYLQLPANEALIKKLLGEETLALAGMLIGLGILIARWYTENSLVDKVPQRDPPASDAQINGGPPAL